MNDWGTGFAALRIDDPLVAWLVYRAELVSSSLAHEQRLLFWRDLLVASVGDPTGKGCGRALAGEQPLQVGAGSDRPLRSTRCALVSHTQRGLGIHNVDLRCHEAAPNGAVPRHQDSARRFG
jgi:hypothetical protein